MPNQVLIKKENIKVKVKVQNWQEAVRAAAKPLEGTGSITPEYTQAMVDAVEEMGPYMVIMPKFALAHAAPSSSVMRNDVSLVTLDKPVRFGCENDPVSVVLCICCVDRQSHTKLLKRIAILMMEDGIIDKIADACSLEEIYSFVQES